MVHRMLWSFFKKRYDTEMLCFGILTLGRRILVPVCVVYAVMRVLKMLLHGTSGATKIDCSLSNDKKSMKLNRDVYRLLFWMRRVNIHHSPQQAAVTLKHWFVTCEVLCARWRRLRLCASLVLPTERWRLWKMRIKTTAKTVHHFAQ